MIANVNDMPSLIHMNQSNVVPELSVYQLPKAASYALLDNGTLHFAPTGLHTLPDCKENWKGLEFDHINDTN